MDEAPLTRPGGEQCPDCHAVVVDLAAHERWHTRLVADLAKAVAAELKRV